MAAPGKGVEWRGDGTQRKAVGSADSAVGTVIASADGSGEVNLEVIAGSAIDTIIRLSERRGSKAAPERAARRRQQGEAAAKAVVASPRNRSKRSFRFRAIGRRVEEGWRSSKSRAMQIGRPKLILLSWTNRRPRKHGSLTYRNHIVTVGSLVLLTLAAGKWPVRQVALY